MKAWQFVLLGVGMALFMLGLVWALQQIDLNVVYAPGAAVVWHLLLPR